MTASDVLISLAAVPVTAAASYLAVLALAARRQGAPAGSRGLVFDIVVPAHNEEGTIDRTLASLLALDYRREQFRILVVADNCTDHTADVARASGAIVLERNDPTRPGKGHALAHAYAASLADGFADAVVVVDADTVVSANLLTAFAYRLENGAESVQADYGVRNATKSWRTRLLSLAFTLHHTVRSLGRERLGLSCGLRGNGMGFSSAVLRRVPYAAFSLAEDVEYGLTLGLAGVRVAYVAEAEVLGDMPSTGAAARSQRERWECGRRALARRYVPALIRAGARRLDLRALDLAMDLLVPPLTTLAAATVVGTAAAAALWLAGGASFVGPACWAASCVALCLYVGRGYAIAGAGFRGIQDLAWAPVYAVWKFSGVARPDPQGRGEWIRTRREGES